MSEIAAGGPAVGGSPPPVDAGEALLVHAVDRFRRGDDREGAFRLIYETFFPAMTRFYARKGLSPDDALDLTQQTFLGIYRGLERYEHRERFAAWIFHAATTTYLKWRRAAHAAKRSAVEISHDAGPLADPALASPGGQLDGLLTDERRTALRGAVQALPAQMRDCLVLRVYHQLAYAEIATVKGISTETVKAHLARARKKLADELGDAYAEWGD